MHADNRHRRVTIGQVEFDNVTRAETLDQMERWIAEGGEHRICTPNADHIILAQRLPEFKAAISTASLVIPDGMGVIYASRLLGTPLRQNVGGRLLLPAFAERSVKAGYRLFLLGGHSSDVCHAAAAALTRRYPSLQIAGLYTPPHAARFSDEETARMIETVIDARPDVLFVALGTPKQEVWLHHTRHQLPVPVKIGVGAAFDILAGRVPPVPRLMTDIGLEWLVRLGNDQRRLWARYLIRGPQFVALVLRQRAFRNVTSC